MFAVFLSCIFFVTRPICSERVVSEGWIPFSSIDLVDDGGYQRHPRRGAKVPEEGVKVSAAAGVLETVHPSRLNRDMS